MTVNDNAEAIAQLRADTDEAIAGVQGLALDVPKTLGQALSWVYRRVGYVQKARSHGLRYSFAGEAALIRAIRPVMAEAGLVGPYPVATVATVVEHPPTKNGAKQTRHEVLVTYELMHGPTREALRMQVPGLGIDSGDKGTAKAMTGAYKYVLRQLFCIETGDDPDETPSTDQESSVAAVSLAVDPKTAMHDAEWDDDRVTFCAQLREIGVGYETVRDWGIGAHGSKPSTWGSAGRGAFIRDLLAGKLADIYQPARRMREPGED